MGLMYVWKLDNRGLMIILDWRSRLTALYSKSVSRLVYCPALAGPPLDTKSTHLQPRDARFRYWRKLDLII